MVRFFVPLLLAVWPLAAAPPVIRDIAPHGAQRGKTFQLLLKGSGLTPGARLDTTLPAGISRLAPPASAAEMRPDSELPFLVELGKDAPIGVYPLRVLTADGLSNVVLFSVSDLPEIEEKETSSPKQANGEIAAAEPVPTPVVVNGTLTAADVDLYSFTARAGQKLVFEVEAAVTASAIDAAIELLDSAGKTIARNDDAPGNGTDPRLEHTFARPGAYYLRIHDSKYSDQAQNHYRLKIGSYPFADAMFPLGWRRGEPVTVELTGGNLAAPVTVKPDTSLPRRYVPVAVPGSASLPQLFQLGDKPEILEPAATADRALPPATIVNGRIAAKGEVDRYTLAVRPGQQWIVELAASSTGASQLDALVTLYDESGRKLASRDDLGSADPVIPFEVPAGVNRITVAVEDLMGRGGPGFAYRLEARREAADFTLQLATPFVNVPAGGTAIVNVGIQRRGYDGAIRIDLPNLPPGFHQAGGTVAPAAASQRFDDPNPRFGRNAATLTITADPGVAAQQMNLAVRGIAALPDGGRIVRYATGPGLVVAPRGLRQRNITAAWLEMDLPMATAKPLPARIATPVHHVRIAQGVEYPLNFKVEGAAAPGRVQGRARENIATQIGNLRILQGAPPKDPNAGQLLLATNFATPATPWDFLIQMTVDVNGKPTDIYAPMVTVDTVPGYQVLPAATAWRTTPGAAFAIVGAIFREPTFEGGLVKVEVQDLPEGAACSIDEVPAEQREFLLTCHTAASTPKGSYEVRLVSQAPDTGRKAKDTYKGPEVTARLEVQ